MGRPPDARDAAQDLARELADLAAQLASLKGEANVWLSDERYDALRHRLEDAHASVEASCGGGKTQGTPQRGTRMTRGTRRSGTRASGGRTAAMVGVLWR